MNLVNLRLEKLNDPPKIWTNMNLFKIHSPNFNLPKNLWTRLYRIRTEHGNVKKCRINGESETAPRATAKNHILKRCRSER